MKEFILSQYRDEEAPSPITVIDEKKIQRKRHFSIISGDMAKQYRIVPSKRFKTENYGTYPYGY